MYEQLKKRIPKTFIKNNEKLLRNLVSIFYIGNNYQCNICNFKMSRFIKLNNNNRLCPKCGSLPRTRKLWDLLQHEIQDKTVLHFSPSSSIKRKIELFDNITYVTSDYAGEFIATKRLDIESIDEPNDTYDIIICYHVLEHIEHDIKAMKELLRIIKPTGRCFIQTPFKTGDTYENDEVKTDEERLIHFGQKDHVRIYSAENLMDRLESVGFHTKLRVYETADNNTYGFNSNEKVIIAEKPVTSKDV